MKVTGTVNGQNVTICDITPVGAQTILVSYVTSTSALNTTVFNYDPKLSSTVTIATSAVVVS